MSRKSARILCRRRRESTVEEDEIVQTFGKRKAEDELEGSDEVTKRRKQFQQQNQWVPIPEQAAVGTCFILAGADATSLQHLNNNTPTECVIGGNFRLPSRLTTPIPLRNSPLPTFQWADSQEVWQLMLQKENFYIREPQMLAQHPSLQPRMRSILLDWLIEVCEVYRLHRETLYLAIDFIDRYLTVTKGIEKQQLQLIGISSLFIAAKLEEIYPPKLTEFCYVTDGACTEGEILEQELVMLKALKWDLSPMTTNSWLNVFLQLVNIESLEEKEQNNFVFPQYSQHAFIQIARLLDLCFLDIGCLQFPYSMLATSALYHMSSEAVALSVSGYQWRDIVQCVQWMAPFAMTLREAGTVDLKFFQSIPRENLHNIQTHSVDMSLLERAQMRQQQVILSLRASPDVTQEIPGIITPPQSTKSKRKSHPQEATPPQRAPLAIMAPPTVRSPPPNTLSPPSTSPPSATQSSPSPCKKAALCPDS